MPKRCIICGAIGATCGTPTRVLPVDQVVTGYIVAGDKLLPHIPQPPSDMSDEEREEYELMAVAMNKRSLRTQLREREEQAMSEGKAAHTSLSYVDRGDGILVKMAPDVAKQYVDTVEGASIVKEGALPQPKEGEVIGATKARVGEVFNEDGTQKDDIQPMTSRMFNADMRTRNEAVPAVDKAVPNSTGTPSETTETITPSPTGSTTSEPTLKQPPRK